MKPEPLFFARPEDFRAWLEANHATASELWVGFHKRGSGEPSITWPESVDEALCYGWIDGVRKRLDEASYVIRFSPRKPGSTWSRVNIERVQALTRLGRMRPAGLAAAAARREERSGIYGYEQQDRALSQEQEQEFRGHEAAWKFFRSQAPSYQRAAIWWVISAKKDETRARRLAALIEDSRNRRRIDLLTSPARRDGADRSGQ